MYIKTRWRDRQFSSFPIRLSSTSERFCGGHLGVQRAKRLLPRFPCRFGVRVCVIPDSLARKRPPLGRLDSLLFQEFHFADAIRLRRGFLRQDRVKVLARSNSIYLPEPIAFRAVRRPFLRRSRISFGHPPHFVFRAAPLPSLRIGFWYGMFDSEAVVVCTTVLLHPDVFARRDDFEPPKNRLLTRAALFAVAALRGRIASCWPVSNVSNRPNVGYQPNATSFLVTQTY